MACNFPLARSTLPEAAAERLRTLIIEGVLAPGARLNERELSEQLGVSRTPLREAFRMLAADWPAGPAAQPRRPGRGPVARGSCGHAFEVMASLEGLAGELAAKRVADADHRRGSHGPLQADMEAGRTRRRDLPAVAIAPTDAIRPTASTAIAGNPILTRTAQGR